MKMSKCLCVVILSIVCSVDVVHAPKLLYILYAAHFAIFSSVMWSSDPSVYGRCPQTIFFTLVVLAGSQSYSKAVLSDLIFYEWFSLQPG